MGVPFHSQYFWDATKKVINEGLDDEEIWTAEGLQIPVYHTEDGRFTVIISSRSLILSSICVQHLM